MRRIIRKRKRHRLKEKGERIKRRKNMEMILKQGMWKGKQEENGNKNQKERKN